MTFFGEYVLKKEEEKIKANPKSSMLILEFCINLKQKQNCQEWQVVCS